MKHKAQNTLKKHLLLFAVITSLFSSTSFAAFTDPQSDPLTASINAAPPSFPTAGRAFKKIYSGDLSATDAQTQPWFESYETLYTKLSPLNNPDPAILTPTQCADLLTNLQQKTVTSDAADTQFQAAQTALKLYADTVFSS